MAYEEYDYYNEPSTGSLKESLYEILHGLRDPQKLREAGESLKSALQLTPNVTESLARGGVAQAVGTSGDLRDLRNTINSYLPKSVRNFTQAAEFLANPYATAIQQTAPTTEQTLDFVPRATAPYEGYKQHETIGEYIAPSLGYFGGKVLKAGKDLPGGLSIMGPESKLWEPAMAFEAAKMESKGVPADEIKRITGMARGMDQQWKSELSDFWSSMKGKGTFGEIHGKVATDKDALIKDVFEHPELLEAYPHLGEVKVKTLPKDSPVKGSYNEAKNEIHVREDLTPDQAKSTILHELTHGIQAVEGMNRGANYGQLVKHFAKQKEGIMSQIEKLNIEGSQAYKANDINKYHELMAERDALSKQYIEMDPEKLGYEAYRHHAGEAEARMVQERAGMTPDQLRETYPYQYGQGALDINPDQAIVTTRHPATINMPEQSIEPPKSKQDELGFHSALETAVLGIKQPKGTGEQFLKQLEKTPGVKTEELEVTGLKKYLQDHKFITKEEVEKYISQQRLYLENKILKEGTGEGNYEDYQLRGGEVYDDDEYIRSLADDFHHDLKNDPDLFQAEKDALLERYPELYEGHDTNPYMDARLNQDVEDALWDQAKQQAHDMYYENPIRHYYDDFDYDIYGNDDMGYSIKDPNGSFLNIGGRNGLYDLSDAEQALREHHLEQGNLNIDEEGAAKYADYVLPGRHNNYREVLATLPANMDPNIIGSKEYREALHNVRTDGPNNRLGELIQQAERENYESGHFDEPNILAHMRVDDRMINGKKTLMVEEIQSDWHQEGRKKGYTKPLDKDEAFDLSRQLDSLQKDKKLLLEKRDEAEGAGNVVEKLDYVRQIDEISRQQYEIRKALEGSKGVPDAPFKKNWQEMMVKQALDIAAKGDYEAIAFTTGKQQAARYNLSKQIDALDLIPAKEGDKQFVLQAWKDGRNVVRKAVNEDELADYVGKEVAEKLLAQEPKGLHRPEGIAHGNPNVFEGRELTGLDLETGGEGMKGFYDKMVPDFINKYTKKWGMGMKKANLEHTNARADLTDEELLKGLEKIGMDSRKYYQLPISERSEIYQKISNEFYPREKDQVHFVELTDAAKKDIKEKGQPLFAGLGAIAGVDYMEGLDEQNKAGIFKDLMKPKK
jgi:hypothetical protein